MFNHEDVFIEKIVERKKSTKDYLLIALYISLFLLVLFLCYLFLYYIIAFLLLIIAGAAFGLYYLISLRNIEYEYICTNGTLDIDEIINKRKRKRRFSVKSSSMEILAPVLSPDYAHHERRKLNLFDFSSNTTNENVWFFVADYKDKKHLVLFEPNDRMLKDLKRYNPSKVQYNFIQA